LYYKKDIPVPDWQLPKPQLWFMQLTPNFTLEELTFSATAKRNGFIEQDNPSQAVIANLLYLCEEVLEPIRERVGPFKPTSAYRCGRLNNKVRGSKRSFHLSGCAADINLGTKEKNCELFTWISTHLPFTELINEYDFSWVHVAIVKGREEEKTIKIIG
jgi:zinc D-Ala-D-Ala carboxypeptidase